jgi:putative NADH-flavin reductase
MKIAVIGATGMIGSAVTQELLAKGHEVTAIARNPRKTPDHTALRRKAADIFNFDQLTGAIVGHDVVISAYAPAGGNGPEAYKALVEAGWRIKRVFKQVCAGGYLINIGGASSLWTPNGFQMFEDPAWPSWFFNAAPPEHFRYLHSMTGNAIFLEFAETRERILADPAQDPRADWPAEHLLAFIRNLATNHNKGEGGRAQLEFFVDDHSFRWSFASPPWFLRPGARTGVYRTVIDKLPVVGHQPDGISVADFALAVADEAEAQQYLHRHWSAARPAPAEG